MCSRTYGKNFVRYYPFEREIWWDGAFAVFRPFDIFLTILNTEESFAFRTVIRLFVKQDAHFLRMAQMVSPCEKKPNTPTAVAAEIEAVLGMKELS